MQKKLEKTTAWHINNNQNYHFHRVQSSFWVSNTTESKITQTWSLAVWKRFEDFWLGIWLNMGNRRCFAGHAFMVWPMEELGQWSIHFSRSHMSLLLPVVPGSGSLTHQHPPRFPLPALYLFFFPSFFYHLTSSILCTPRNLERKEGDQEGSCRKCRIVLMAVRRDQVLCS